MNALFYLILISTLINCNLFEINAQNYCESCSSSEKICYKNQCKCGPNYRLNTTLHICEHFDCYKDTECQEFDKNRKCSDKKCNCVKSFKENGDTKICQKLPKECSYNSDCEKYGHQVCVDKICECLPNYKWDLTNETCIHFYCNSDNDCKGYDQNRVCLNDKCICSTNFVEDYDNKKCVKMRSCTSLNDCDQNQFCINNQFCRCQPNYGYSAETSKCEYHSCNSNSDCDQYDSKSMCDGFGRCKCKSDYVLDPKTKICNKTVEVSCNSISDCGENQFCINDLCECRSGYYQVENSCYSKSCNFDSDCNFFDKNSVCASNKCKCRSGYTLDPTTKLCKIRDEKSCNSIDDCGTDQFCTKNLCECQPNYEFDDSSLCKFKPCSYDSDCNQFDSNRICNSANGKCESCKTYYKIDESTKFCNTTVGKYCSSIYDCIEYQDNNQVCVDNKCYCKQNYKLDTNSVYCSYHSCLHDSDCQTYDKHRICNEGSCECENDYKEDSSSLKCTYGSTINGSDESNNNGNIWTIFFIITLILLLISVVGTYYYVVKKKANSLQESNIRFHYNPPIIQENSNLSIISHNVNIDDPPPPYSTLE